MNFSMNFSNKPDTPAETKQNCAESSTVLAREAGVPFQPPMDSVSGSASGSASGSVSGVDPFVEWLSLMEVVQMLCPVWPVRDKPMQGSQWRL